MNSSLTEKQERFCQEYLIDFNGAQAAIRAGYGAKSAKVTASRMLTNANLQKRLSELSAETSEEYNVTKERVLQEIVGIGLTPLNAMVKWGPDGISVVPDSELTPIQLASAKKVSVTERCTKDGDRIVTTTIEQHSKDKALDYLSKLTRLLDTENASEQSPTLVVPSMLDHDEWMEQAEMLRKRATTIEHDVMTALGEMS